jgi:isopentenyl-diphosphate delta-isomerase
MAIIGKRKQEHINICLNDFVQYKKLKPGFDDVKLVYNAMPDMDYSKVDTSCMLLGKKLYVPLVIEAMTGGFEKAGHINKSLAMVAQKYGFAMGLGSQRPMLEKKELVSSYCVRDVAPDILLIGNIGITQLIKLYKTKKMKKLDTLVQKPELNAMAVHFNPLQEIIQPEGDKDFSGTLKAVSALATHLKKYKVPVIVKEVGSGISAEVAKKLKKTGISMIDVAGAGGTSWSKVEYLRGRGKIKGFEEFGLPTVVSLLMCKKYLPVISSGGVRSGIDIAKSIVLGAEAAGTAQPFLKSYARNRLETTAMEWTEQFRATMFLVGAKNVKELKKKKYILTGKTKEWVSNIST